MSELSDCAEIQRTLNSENSFSESDLSLDVSSASLGSVEVSNTRSVCSLCTRFIHSEYMRARARKSQVAAVDGVPLCQEAPVDSVPLKECCISYYDRWLW